jgi:hypothetical protein
MVESGLLASISEKFTLDQVPIIELHMSGMSPEVWWEGETRLLIYRDIIALTTVIRARQPYRNCANKENLQQN